MNLFGSATDCSMVLLVIGTRTNWYKPSTLFVTEEDSREDPCAGFQTDIGFIDGIHKKIEVSTNKFEVLNDTPKSIQKHPFKKLINISRNIRSKNSSKSSSFEVSVNPLKGIGYLATYVCTLYNTPCSSIRISDASFFYCLATNYLMLSESGCIIWGFSRGPIPRGDEGTSSVFPPSISSLDNMTRFSYEFLLLWMTL